MLVLEIVPINPVTYHLVSYYNDTPEVIGVFGSYELAEAELNQYLTYAF